MSSPSRRPCSPSPTRAAKRWRRSSRCRGIAQTIVALGIEFGDIPTKATLAAALLYALRNSGVEVVRRRRTGAG